MELTWGRQLSVGNVVIDSDHRNLIDTVNGIEHAIRTEDCSAMSQAFESLEDLLYAHLANEEKIARAVNFDFPKYRMAQQYSLREFQHLRDEVVARKGIWCKSAMEHYSNFLRGWMTEHIIKVDMPMKPMLQALGYQFWPSQCDDEDDRIAGVDCSTSGADMRRHDCYSLAAFKPASPVPAKPFSAYPA